MTTTIDTSRYCNIAENLPADAAVTFHAVDWEEYEELLEQVGEARGLRISYGDGTLTITTLSDEHESYADFVKSMVSLIRLRFRMNIRFFGSTTMKKRKPRKGLEPDAWFYVQSAEALGKRIHLNFEKDPPPDVAVEIDIHHDSRPKFSIYAALGVPEIWRYDGRKMSIHVLKEVDYVTTQRSEALPLLTGDVLTEFLTRLREEGELDAVLAFDEWLKTQRS